MKKQIKNCLMCNYLYIILFFLFIILQYSCIIMADDYTYLKVSKIRLLDNLINILITWSSRWLVDSLSFFFLKMIKITNSLALWSFVNAGISVLMAYSLFNILSFRTKPEKDDADNSTLKLFIVFSILMYPFPHMGTAGWIVTTITYFWTASFGFFSIYNFKKLWYQKNINFLNYIIFFFSNIFAANQEQMSLLLLSVYCLVGVYNYIRNIKAKHTLFCALQFLMCLLTLIFHLFYPAKKMRYLSEMRYFTNYSMMSFVDKIDMGFSSAMQELAMSYNFIFLLFSFLLMVYIFIIYKDSLYKVISCIPFGITILFFLRNNTSDFLPFLIEISNPVTLTEGVITVINYTDFLPYLKIFLFFLVFFTSVISLFLCEKRIYDGIFLACIFVLGILSRMILGFSPTVWASSKRTYVFLYFIIIFLTCYLFREILKIKKMNYLMYIAGIIAIIAYIRNIVFIENFFKYLNYWVNY